MFCGTYMPSKLLLKALSSVKRKMFLVKQFLRSIMTKIWHFRIYYSQNEAVKHLYLRKYLTKKDFLAKKIANVSRFL